MDNRKNILSNESGQSIVEFVLLLAMVVGISFSFMRVINSNLGDIWTKYAQILISDTDNKENLELR